ncbi:MAG: serine/threonine protein phosphatase [Aureispira sp.]|nr:serine/threonine protein phosphatase [Aureispira sp.]
MRILAISDIHGCFNTFKRLLKQVDLQKTDQLYLLGDYVDRGPHSKEVLDYIIYLQGQGYTLRCLRGNHEQMMLNALVDEEKERAWRMNGGTATLTSFGAFMPKDIPARYYKFIHSLEYFFETEDYLFVHAGFNMREEDPFEDKHAMIWIRKWEKLFDADRLGHKTVVHGHTPQTTTEIKDRFEILNQKSVLTIDNGCGYSFKGGGQLCAVDLTNEQLYFEPNID